jgi:hypothetical protein
VKNLGHLGFASRSLISAAYGCCCSEAAAPAASPASSAPLPAAVHSVAVVEHL